MQIIKEGSIELQIEEKPTAYWKRNRKPAISFIYDTPFAADRQLEDQRLLMEKNKNPQFYNPTKVDKPRSFQIAAKQGAARAVAMKANVLNKIVRESSGIHNYTIVPPPRTKKSKGSRDDGEEEELLDPETNPYVKPYAKEAKSKPIICSFGHRPRSASRTFHPATMKFRLKHGEVLPTTDTKRTNVGLPVAVLAKVLHAPHISDNPFEIEDETNNEDIEESDLLTSSIAENGEGGGYSDLFFTQEQQQDLLYNNPTGGTTTKKHFQAQKKAVRKLSPLPPQQQHHTSHASVATEEHSWISSVEEAEQRKHKKKVSTTDLLPSVSNDGRPAWDEAFHRIKFSPNHMFEIRQSKINPKSTRPLKELLTRYVTFSFFFNLVLWCFFFHPFAPFFFLSFLFLFTPDFLI